MSTPIDTAQPFYLQSEVGTTVTPDFQGGTLRDDQNNVTDSNNYTVENFSTNTIDAFGHTTTFSGTFSGAGPLTITSSVPNGTVVMTGASALGGAVTIDNGATLQWGAGNSAFLVGGGNAVVDNGALVMNFGGGGVGGAIPISGAGIVKILSGALTESGAATYTGVTTIAAGGFLNLSGSGSIADSSNVIDSGVLDISGTTAGASITTLNGSGGVSLGGQILTLAAASATFSGVMADGGLFGGTGGGLTLGGGTETLTGTNTYTGATTIDTGATLQLGNHGTTGTVAGAIVDNGLVRFDYSGAVTTANGFSGSGSAEVVAGTVVITNATALGGAVTIDNGATMQWGAGAAAFLVGGGNAVVDNGALVMNFGGGGIGGAIAISGTGAVKILSGSLNDSGASTYTGATTIAAAGFLALSGSGSIADSSNVLDSGVLDISGTTAGASITTLGGSGGVSLGGQVLTLTAASGTFTGVMADGGLYSGTGGGLTLAGGTETLTGTNTYTGATMIDLGATLKLGNGGSTGTVAGAIVDNGFVRFDYSGAVTTANSFSGSGLAEVVAGTVVITGESFLGGAVVIDNGATMQWGASSPAFLLGGGNAVVDNGALVMNFGGGGVSGGIPILGSGSLKIQTGALTESSAGTYAGVTTIAAAGSLNLFESGSIADSSNVIDNGKFDISGATAGASITTLSGSGGVSLGGKTLTLTAASGTFSGVIADGGLFGGTGGGLTVAHGTETLTGTNTYTGATTIGTGATVRLGDGGTTGTVAGAIVDDGLARFDYSGVVTTADTLSGGGSAEVAAGRLVVTGASALGGAVTIDNGATLQWGAGSSAFLIGGGNAVVDNGALVMNFGGGGVSRAIATTGTGAVKILSGSLTESGASTYAGATTIAAAGSLNLSGAGSIADSSSVTDDGKFDISGTTAGAAITTLSGSGGVSLGGRTLTLTAASGTFSGVIANGGLYGGTGGGLTIAHGTEILTGANTYTGATTIDLGATLKLSAGGGGTTVAGTVTGAGSLAFAGGTAALSAGAALSIAKVLQSGGQVNSTTNLAYAGVWNQSAGTLSVASGRTLTFTGSGDVFSGILTGAGTVKFAGGSDSLNGATLSAASTVIDGAAVTLAGSLTLTKTLYVTSPDLTIASTGASLSGGGTLALTNLATNKIVGGVSTAKLTNTDDEITGAGQLGGGSMILINQAAASIIGDSASVALVIDTGAQAISNAGLIASKGSGGVSIKSAVINTGALVVTAGVLTAQAAVSGAGSVRIGGGTADFMSTFSQNVSFTGASGVLELAKSQSYGGAISGFSLTGGTSLDLGDIGFTSGKTKATFVENGAKTSGVLTVTDGTHTAHITLVGNYSSSTFTTSSDGHGGTIVVDPPKGAAAPAPRVEPTHVQRFISAMASFDRGAGHLVPAAESGRWTPPLVAAAHSALRTSAI